MPLRSRGWRRGPVRMGSYLLCGTDKNPHGRLCAPDKPLKAQAFQFFVGALFAKVDFIKCRGVFAPLINDVSDFSVLPGQFSPMSILNAGKIFAPEKKP